MSTTRLLCEEKYKRLSKQYSDLVYEYKEIKSKMVSIESLKNQIATLQKRLQSQDRKFVRQLCIEFIKQGMKDPEDILELVGEIIKGIEGE